MMLKSVQITLCLMPVGHSNILSTCFAQFVAAVVVDIFLVVVMIVGFVIVWASIIDMVLIVVAVVLIEVVSVMLVSAFRVRHLVLSLLQ